MRNTILNLKSSQAERCESNESIDFEIRQEPDNAEKSECQEPFLRGKGQQLLWALQSRRKDSHLPMDGSKEKPAKFLTGINGHMWTVIWIRTPKGLSLRGSVHGLSTASCWFSLSTQQVHTNDWGRTGLLRDSWDPSQSKTWKEQRLKMESANLRYLSWESWARTTSKRDGLRPRKTRRLSVKPKGGDKSPIVR